MRRSQDRGLVQPERRRAGGALFEDAGISGSGIAKRDGLEEALEGTTKGRALVTYRLSRLARNTRDMLDIAERLEKKGADQMSLSERIDATAASRRTLFRLLAVLAEFEREQIGERTRIALAHKKASGEVYATLLSVLTLSLAAWSQSSANRPSSLTA